MKFNTALTLLLTSATTQAALSSEEAGALNILFQDINENRDEYQSYIVANTEVAFPTTLVQIYTAMTTYTDDSYTTLFADLPDDQVTSIEQLVTALPWYSTRLLPEIVSEFAGASAAASGSASGSVAATATDSDETVVVTAHASSYYAVSGSASAGGAYASGSGSSAKEHVSTAGDDGSSASASSSGKNSSSSASSSSSAGAPATGSIAVTGLSLVGVLVAALVL
ncbi:unnamed protein product [Ambrosiozyma monospora]|uniref:Unnamed protein product n=1 Tax=Ambrosiozyma monospora TaxID=43982 RepID=A0ACB5SWC1_AMBMO|nr:unnamed protein product [Ambrosiozyma monospora]